MVLAMKKHSVILCCLGLCSLYLSGACAAERDSVRRSDLFGFGAVSVSDGIETVVSSGVDGVTVVAGRGMMSLLKIEVDGDTLKIGVRQRPEGGRTSRRKERATVYVPRKEYRSFTVADGAALRLPEDYRADILRIGAASGGNVRGGLHCTALILSASSGSTVRLEGVCDSLVTEAVGGAQVRCEALQAGNVACRAASGALVRVYASRGIDVTASGGARVVYDGGGEAHRVAVRSGASLKRKE